jgi:transposase
LSTKIHLLADSFGRPVQITIAPGQSSDLAPACAMIAGQTARYVLADRAYDAGYFRDAITGIGAEPVIPPHPTRKHPARYDRRHYRARNQIERLVGRLKRFRRIATRYDRRALYFLSAIQLVATLEWMPPYVESA